MHAYIIYLTACSSGIHFMHTVYTDSCIYAYTFILYMNEHSHIVARPQSQSAKLDIRESYGKTINNDAELLPQTHDCVCVHMCVCCCCVFCI